jgi:[calcium/calmodulin-dependent protein kinase] kinase
MEPLIKHRLAKLNYSNVLKNQKKINSKSNQKNNEMIKLSDTNTKINGFNQNTNNKNNNQKFYNKNFFLNNNAIFKSNMHNSKANSLNNYINNFKNINHKNSRTNTGNYSYNLNKIIKENNSKINNNINNNNKLNTNNKKSEINNKRIIINVNSKTNSKGNMMNILNKKKNNNSFNFNNINKLNNNNNKINNNKIIPGLKNNKKSIDTSIKNNKLINSFTPNIIINDINNKTYNNKTFNLNIINSNSNNFNNYNNTNLSNLNNNFNNNGQMKTLSNNAITECPNIINKTNTISINLNMPSIPTANNKNLKDDTNINYGKSQISENKTNIFETDKVTVTYDKKTGNKIVNDFYFLETIGRGAYSKVKKCVNLKTNEEFAVKILNKRLLRKKKKSYGKTKEGTLKINYMIEDALNEIYIYKSIQGTNKNVLKLYQILNDNKKDKTYLIMELAEKGPLVTLNEKLGIFCINSNYRDDIYDENLIKTWIYDTANGLKFLHDNNIVHRDIKSDNILIDKNGHCKIADFGCSIKLKNGQPDIFSKTEGNMYFFPPEFVDGKNKKQFGYKPVDIWALGISIYTCIFKSLPFLPENRENVVELFKEIREAKFDFNRNGIKISKEMETLLLHILEKDPQKRFTAKDIVEYPWLNIK